MMMACGHSANATCDGKSVCAICYGLTEGATVVVETPNFEGRVAQCGCCSQTVPSSDKLAFFEHNPDSAKDRFYCGCCGWD